MPGLGEVLLEKKKKKEEINWINLGLSYLFPNY